MGRIIIGRMDEIDDDRDLGGWTLYDYDDELHSSATTVRGEQRRQGHHNEHFGDEDKEGVVGTERLR